MASEELRKFRLQRAKDFAERKPKLPENLPEIAKKADDLLAIKETVDSAATVSGALWLSYLFVMFYIAVAAGAVTHEDLLLQRPVKLPFLNVELPLLAFFFLAPLLFVATHVYTIVHFNMLGQKAARFHAELHHQLKDKKEIRDKLRRLLPSNVLVQIFAGPPELRGGRFGFILKSIVVLTLVACPVLLLMLLQIQFLPFHDGRITWTQRGALIFDIAILWILRPPALLNGVGGWSFHGGEGETAPKRVRVIRVAGLALTGFLSLLAIWLSVGVATIPDEWQENYFDPTRRFLFAGEVDHVTRRRRSYFSNTLVLPGFDIYVALKIDDKSKLDWKHHLIDLRGRALDRAVFSDAKLPKADLTGAQLQGATLEFAQLQGASLNSAKLQGASLQSVKLQGASLYDAQFQGASLKLAKLQGASLDGTQLQNASLDDAQLQGASLDTAQLQGASLNSAKLQGASLEGAQLQGASLSGAQLQGATLDYAELQSAWLNGAHFQGASLPYARLQGASLDDAQLQGVSLEKAQLHGASLHRVQLESAALIGTYLWRADWGELRPVAMKSIRIMRLKWTAVNLRDDTLIEEDGPWTGRTYEKLRTMIEKEVPEGDLRDNALKRIARLDCKESGDDLSSCDANADPPPELQEWRKALEAARADEATYKKALAQRLHALVCSSDANAIHILRGLSKTALLGNEPRLSRLEAAGRDAPALIDDILGGHDCPVSSALTDADKARLQKIKAAVLNNKSELPDAAKAPEPSPAASPPAPTPKTPAKGKGGRSPRDPPPP